LEKEEVIKIALVGPESTGKSTLSVALAQHYKTVYVSEYARAYFTKYSINDYSIHQIEEIYKEQIKREQEAVENMKGYLFCDTALISGKIWSDFLYGHSPEFIERNWRTHRYHLYLLCDIDLPWKEDSQRKNESDRIKLYNSHLHLLNQLAVPFNIISGLGDERLQKAILAVEEFAKTNNANPRR